MTTQQELLQYEKNLPNKWTESYYKLKETLLKRIPFGFELSFQYGMPTFVVPLSKYPDGYLNRITGPLPFISFAAQKNYLALYHLGIMADPNLLKWFQEKYAKTVSTKLNMGKSCIRFTNPSTIPYKLIGELVEKMSVEQWISLYDTHRKK